MERIITPWDTTPKDKLIQVINGANIIRFMVYGINIPDVFSALENAYKRGADIRGIFDLSSTRDIHEKNQLRAFFQVVPQSLFLIGTSPKGGQIIHLKCLYTDYLANMTPPSNEAEMTWEQALVAHSPVTISGSFNFTTQAPVQVNNMDISADTSGAAQFDVAFNQLWSFIEQNQKQPNFSTVSLREKLMGVLFRP